MSRKNKKEMHTDTTGLTRTELSHPILLKKLINRSTVYFVKITVITLTHVRLPNIQKHSRNSSAPNITPVMHV